MKLLKKLKACKPYRGRYRIRPGIRFTADQEYYCCFIPTIFWIPWIYRCDGMCIFELWWLNFHIAFGKWEQLSCRKCTHQSECIDSGELAYSFDDVFDHGTCDKFTSKE